MKTLKRLVSSLLVFSMIASMFLTVTATTNASELSTQSTQTTGGAVDNIYVDGKLDMDIKTVSTVLSSSQSYSNVLGYNALLNGVYFPSIIELQYQSNQKNNGKLIAATSIGETGRPDSVDPSLGAVLESTDGGATWEIIFRPVETIKPWFWAGQMAQIYELPARLGNMPAGTIIYSVNTVNYGDINEGGTNVGYSHISMFISYDAGKTWTQSPNIIAEGCGLELGVWEPVMFYDNGYLYCFYSDDRGDGVATPDQKLVYQRSKDGVVWEDPVDVYCSTTLADRPGMPVITKMGNGEYFLVYENGKVGSDCYIYYKKTSDITNWNPSDPGKLLTAKVGGKDYKMASSPCCVWSPAGGANGTLFATGRREFGGDGTIRMFVSFDYGSTWETIENPLPYDWYSSAVAENSNDSIGYRPIMVLGADPSTIHYVNITETDYLSGSKMQYAKLKIYDDDNPNEGKNIEDYQKKIVFKVANGRWNDGTTADKIVYVTLSHDGRWNTGGTATLSAPAVGSKPNASFKAGSWDVTPPTTVSGLESVTYTYTYKFETAKTSSVGSETINIGSVRTVLTGNNLHFPSMVELKHQSDPQNNGKLIAAMSANGLSGTMGCVVQSTDGGKTWSVLSYPVETIRPEFWGGNMAHIYELPDQVGNMPAGTLIYSSNTVNYEMYSHIGVWVSNDCGQTWTEISIVRSGGGTGLGVWEPVMFYDNGYLYCFYSDDSGDGVNTPDQKIVYQRSKDCINWEAPVDVCSLGDPVDRPGMPIITKMGNGEYFLVYEYCEGGGARIHYKTTKDITSWNPSDEGTRITVKSGSKTYEIATAPSCLWSPAGGSSGTLFVTGRYMFGGVPYNCIFVSLDYGKTWNIMENPLSFSGYDSFKYTDMGGYRPIMVLGTDPSVIHYINATTASTVKYVTMRINDSDNPNQGKNPLDYQKKIIFRVANGKWNDGTTDDKILYVTLEKDGVWDASGSATITIPEVGNIPYTNFKTGRWSITPSTTVSGTQDAIYTYVYVNDPYENCKNAFGIVLTPAFVNGVCWELSGGNLKMPAGYENNFLLFSNPLANNRIEATISVNDLTYTDPNHRNGIVFALTDHDNDLTFGYADTDVSYYWAFINDWGYVEVAEMGKYQNWHWLTTEGKDLAALGIDVTKGVTLAAEWDAQGNIKIYANGILVHNITDSTPLTGKYYGLLVNDWDNTQTPNTHNAPVKSFVSDIAVYENCTDIKGNLLTPVLVNGICWELIDGNLKMPFGHENSFLLFSDPLAKNIVEATIVVRDNLNGDNNHRNGIVFALTDHDGNSTITNYWDADFSYYWAFINDYGCVEIMEMGKYQNWTPLTTTPADLSALGIDITKGVTLAAEWDTNGRIKVYANGILVQDVTDSTPLTGNYYGLLVNKYGNYDPSYGAYDAPVTSFIAGGKTNFSADSNSYYNCTDAFGNVLNPAIVNDIHWELKGSELKMPAGPESSFLLFNTPLNSNRIEATIFVNDLAATDGSDRNGIVFALTDHDGDLSFNYDGSDVSYYWAFINDWGCVEVIEMGKYQNWHWLTTEGKYLAALGIQRPKVLQRILRKN